MFLLFLPAAGRVWWRPEYSAWEFTLNYIGAWSYSLKSMSNPARLQAYSSGFSVASFASRSRFSIRLACVVSEGLTQHHLLFLPAASRGSGKACLIWMKARMVRPLLTVMYIGSVFCFRLGKRD